MPLELIKVFVPAVSTFTVGILITPILTHYLYAWRVWKKKKGREALDGSVAVEFNRLHGDLETEIKTPRMGGIVIWGSVLITITGMSLLAFILPSAATIKLDFLSRDQTWLPLLALLVGAYVGFVNDVLDVYGEGKGLSIRYRLAAVTILAAFIAWWFYDKLEITSIGIPFGEPLHLGILFIPFFILMVLGLYASGVIDGIDGLSGGVFSAIFFAYSIIAFMQEQYNLAAFSASIVGGILAFLWFNIPPARFYMTETGSMALTLTIGTIALMTDTLGEGIGISVLPVISFLLVATVASNIIQITSKKFFGRKVFRIAPLHHHFEAIGWPSYKVVMRYWVLAIMFACIGVILALVGS